MSVPGSHGAGETAGGLLRLRGPGALLGLRGDPFALLPGGDARGLSYLGRLHAGSAQGLPGVPGLHLLVCDGSQAQGRPGLQGVAGLQVGGAHPVALLQLRNAVPVVQLLGLILASAHIEAVPSCGGQGDGSRGCWKARKSEGSGSRPPLVPGLLPAVAPTTPVPWTSGLGPQSPALLSAADPGVGLADHFHPGALHLIW